MGFTKPFRDLRMSVVVGHKEMTEYDPFSFLVPFELDLWIYIILTTFAVGIYLAIVDKLSPYGHHGKKVQNESEDEFEEMDINEDGTIDEWERRSWLKEKEAMNFHNAIFWSFASFFEQGGEQHPRAWSGRIAAGAWWFGIVIIISTYTANLAAFLTIKNPVDQINSLEQLVSQERVKFTIISDTEIQNFFRKHEKTPYNAMAKLMTEWEKKGEIQYYPTVSEAITVAKNMTPLLALITDSPLADYWKVCLLALPAVVHPYRSKISGNISYNTLGIDCENMRLIGSGFGSTGYGLGLPLKSPYKEELSIAILKLRETGFIDQLDYKWITKASTCASGGTQVDGGGQQIELDSMLGVFYVTYGGFGIAFIVLFLEWIVSCYTSIDKDHPRKPNSFCEAFEDKLHRLRVDFMENWFPWKMSDKAESLQLFAVQRELGHHATEERRKNSRWASRTPGPDQERE